MHKRFKCLDPSTGRIYISRDVIFDESVFPFASLNPNAGARYHSDILLIPSRDNDFTNMTNVPTLSSLPVLGTSVQVQQPFLPLSDMVHDRTEVSPTSVQALDTTNSERPIPDSLPGPMHAAPETGSIHR
jgi:hypothetical protein